MARRLSKTGRRIANSKPALKIDLISKKKFKELTPRQLKKVIKEARAAAGREDIKLSNKEKRELRAADWVILKSSWLLAIRLVDDQLQVLFKSGVAVGYSGSEKDARKHFLGLQRAVSPGRYIWKFLYQRKYKIVRKK